MTATPYQPGRLQSPVIASTPRNSPAKRRAAHRQTLIKSLRSHTDFLFPSAFPGDSEFVPTVVLIRITIIKGRPIAPAVQ